MLRDVLREYSVYGGRLCRVRAGNNNEHWFTGQYVLRRYRAQRPMDTIAFEHAILDHLAGLEWPVAAPLRANDGKRVVERVGRLYSLFPRLPGRRGRPDRPRDPRRLGRMLAQLHQALSTCEYTSPETVFAPLLGVSTTWGTGTHTVEELLDALALNAPEAAAKCRVALQEVRSEVSRLDTTGMRRTLIHGDWHAGNLLYTRGEVTGVLDFDFAHPDLRVADLAASAMVVGEHVASEMIQGYQDVMRLPREELVLLNLHERARILGAVAATLSIRTRGERAAADIAVLVGMLGSVNERWPRLRSAIGID